MGKVSKAGAADPAMPDRLSDAEWFWLTISILIGWVVVPGSIFYYGWKKRFPNKARQVLWIERIDMAVLFTLVLVAAFGTYQYVMQKSTQEGQQLYAQLKDQQDQLIQKQEAALSSNASQAYQGDQFSINVPAGWSESPSTESQWASYGQAKVWMTQVNVFSALKQAKNEELDVVWGPDATGSALAQFEQTDLSDAQGWPDKYALEHPTIEGASQAFVTYNKGVPSDTFEIKLYVHAKGNLFMVMGSLEQPTQSDIDGLKQVVLSFRPN